MADLLAMSADIIDGRVAPNELGPLNRINHQLCELANDLAVVEAFSHCIVFKTDDGLVTFDTSNEPGGKKCVSAIQSWTHDPFNTVVLTHGHIDHVGGCGAFCEAYEGRKPTIVGHENVAARFDRYRMTNGYNHVINERQFGQFKRRGYDLAGASHFLPLATPNPDVTYSKNLMLSVGGLEIELNHARGETDDHTWAWIPKHKAICAGDFFIWAFPNAGTPKKPSATQENGRLHCGIWRRAMPSFSFQPTGCPFAARTGSAVFSMKWLRCWKRWWSRPLIS